MVYRVELPSPSLASSSFMCAAARKARRVLRSDRIEWSCESVFLYACHVRAQSRPPSGKNDTAC